MPQRQQSFKRRETRAYTQDDGQQHRNRTQLTSQYHRPRMTSRVTAATAIGHGTHEDGTSHDIQPIVWQHTDVATNKNNNHQRLQRRAYQQSQPQKGAVKWYTTKAQNHDSSLGSNTTDVEMFIRKHGNATSRERKLLTRRRR